MVRQVAGAATVVTRALAALGVHGPTTGWYGTRGRVLVPSSCPKQRGDLFFRVGWWCGCPSRDSRLETPRLETHAQRARALTRLRPESRIPSWPLRAPSTFHFRVVRVFGRIDAFQEKILGSSSWHRRPWIVSLLPSVLAPRCVKLAGNSDSYASRPNTEAMAHHLIPAQVPWGLQGTRMAK